jgi:beta-glucanase (GH16 family)
MVLLSKASLSQTTRKSADWKLAWSDEFNNSGLPDSSKWSYDVRDKWFNNEVQYYTYADTGNAVVRDGFLYIKALKKNNSNHLYTSARLVTKGKADWLYGKIDIKAKLPRGVGLWPAIWMLSSNNEYGKWPASGEIDIMEHVGFKPDSIFCSIHTKSFNHVIGTQKTKGIFIKDPYASFHVYGLEWNSKAINFLLDDSVVFRFVNKENGYTEWPFDQPFHLIVNIAVGGNWGGQRGIDETAFPAAMLVDYVRVYQRQ